MLMHKYLTDNAINGEKGEKRWTFENINYALYYFILQKLKKKKNIVKKSVSHGRPAN